MFLHEIKWNNYTAIGLYYKTTNCLFTNSSSHQIFIVCMHTVVTQTLVLLIFLSIKIIYHLDTTVSFNQSIYSVSEGESIQPVLVLGNPSSTFISVQVKTTNLSATGKYLIK